MALLNADMERRAIAGLALRGWEETPEIGFGSGGGLAGFGSLGVRSALQIWTSVDVPAADHPRPARCAPESARRSGGDVDPAVSADVLPAGGG